MTIAFQDSGLDNILNNEKSYENILVYNILYRPLMGAKPLHIRFDKMDLLEFMMGVDI